MMTLKLLQLLKQTPCSRAPSAALCLLGAVAQQRCYQAAMDGSETHQSLDEDAVVSAGIGREQLQWAPRRSLPEPSVYSVKVVIKAHDLKFVKMASTVIRDLMLVNFSPKSRDVLPSHQSKGSPLPWVQLAMPPGDVSLPIKRTHYTVIRGPHVHKSSREQFARTTHKRIISYATNNLSELNWFLDSLKLYQFQAVELVVKVTSSSYLLPTSTAEQAAAEQPLLQQHKQRFTHLFGAAAPGSTGGGSSSFSQQSLNGDSGSFAAVQQSLRGLQQAMHDGLLQQRMRLGSSTSYQRWREGLQGKSTAAATATAAAAGDAGALPGQHLQDVAAQQVQGSGLLAQQEEQQQPQQESVQQAFMAAVDKVLLRLKLDVLDRQKFFPYLMAFYTPNDKVTAAEWMHAMLKYGQYRQQQVESSDQAAQTVQALQQYSRISQALALLLLQQWHQEADSSSRRQLVLPDADTVDDMLSCHQEKQHKK